MDIFASQEVEVEMTSWPKDVLVAKRKPRELDLEATAEHQAGYYMLRFESWSKLAYHKLLELLMPPQDETEVPATVTGWPLSHQVVPAQSQNPTVNTRWPLCQQDAEAETQVSATITGGLLCQQVMPAEAKSQKPTVKKRQPLCQQDMLAKEKTHDPALTKRTTKGQLVHQKAMCIEDKAQDPVATMKQSFSKKAYDQNMSTKSQTWQETPDTKTQDPVATKRHMKNFLMYSLRTLKNMVGKTADVPANPSCQLYLALLLKGVEKMKMSKPIQSKNKEILGFDKICVRKKQNKKKRKNDQKRWNTSENYLRITCGCRKLWPKPKWLRIAEVLWIIGFDLGDKIVKYTSSKNELKYNTAVRIWLAYMRLCMIIQAESEKAYLTREYAWSCLLDFQKWLDCKDFLKTNVDPRIPRFIGARVSTKPKIKPMPRGMDLKNCCMFYGGQGMSGMLPVLALAPLEGATVLDLCAAVGHHSILIGMLLQNTGMVVSNALITDDLPQLWGNIHRFGVSSVIITHLLLHKFPQEAMVGKFGHVLVDAPCSGTGVIRKHERGHWHINEIEQLHLYTKLQQALLLKAIDSLTTGGHLVYSTSSVLVEENEAVVSYALSHRNIKLVNIALPFGEPGLINHRGYKFNMAMKKCRRVYPHHNKTEGIFLAKIIKL